MAPLDKRQIGNTELNVSCLGLGARGIVDPYLSVNDEQGLATVEKALNFGINYVDTAPRYGNGRSESLVGRVLSQRRRERFVLSTKVGRILQPTHPEGWIWDFSRQGVRQSLESSLQRLGLDHVDILFIHSPDNHYPEAITEAYPQLAELRAQGVVKAIGVGITQWQMALRFAQEGDFDCFLLASRYTLLEQTALPVFLPYCEKHNISVIIGGPYNSGILASKLQPSAKYDYHDAPPKILAKARRIKAICDRFNVPLKAAALQFVLAHPAVASVIPGSSYPGHMEENFQMVQHPICSELWDSLRDEGLISSKAPTP